MHIDIPHWYVTASSVIKRPIRFYKFGFRRHARMLIDNSIFREVKPFHPRIVKNIRVNCRKIFDIVVWFNNANYTTISFGKVTPYRLTTFSDGMNCCSCL